MNGNVLPLVAVVVSAVVGAFTVATFILNRSDLRMTSTQQLSRELNEIRDRLAVLETKMGLVFRGVEDRFNDKVAGRRR